MGEVGDALRQRHVRELLRDARMRASRSLPVQDAGRSARCHLRVHRRLLQSPPPPFLIGYLSGRPQDTAILDRRCARRPHYSAECRDGRMAPPRASLRRKLRRVNVIEVLFRRFRGLAPVLKFSIHWAEPNTASARSISLTPPGPASKGAGNRGPTRPLMTISRSKQRHASTELRAGARRKCSVGGPHPDHGADE